MYFEVQSTKYSLLRVYIWEHDSCDSLLLSYMINSSALNYPLLTVLPACLVFYCCRYRQAIALIKFYAQCKMYARLSLICKG